MSASEHAGGSPPGAWHCVGCAFVHDLPILPEPGPNATCATCGAPASPCAHLQAKLDALEAEAACLRKKASQMMDADEVARHLRLPSRSAVYRHVARGTLKASYLGRRMLFSREDVEAALRGSR